MLSSVRVGKRKRKKTHESKKDNNCCDKPVKESINKRTILVSSTSFDQSQTKAKNFNAADLLRRQLQLSLPSKQIIDNDNTDIKIKNNPIDDKNEVKSISKPVMKSSEILSESVAKRMKQGNTILSMEKKAESDNTIVLNDSFSSSNAPALRIEDMRKGSRKGKIKQNSNSNSNALSSSTSIQIQQMIQEEIKSSKMSMDEIYARNIVRLGSKYKNNDFNQNSTHGATAGADEDDDYGETKNGNDGTTAISLFQFKNKQLTEKEQYERDKSRQIAHYKKVNDITSKCWWWMESSSFPKYLLLSLGNHISLVKVPSHLALVPGHCYLVPIKHAESFVSCEDEVWDEVQRFRTSIQSMYKQQKEAKSVLFCETVLPSKGLWQARMDVIPVPIHVEQDAPLHFKQALMEQAEEWGTHTKILSTNPHGLRRTIPKTFPYVNIEWNDGGYAQIIESHQYPKHFLLDIIASMMKMDPIRFQRKKKRIEEDRKSVLNFCEIYKPFDWTYDLD